MPEIAQIIANSTGAVAVAFVFLHYLRERDKGYNHTLDSMNNATNRVVENNTKANLVLSSKLQDLASSNKELRTIIGDLYLELLKKSGKSRIAKVYEKKTGD